MSDNKLQPMLWWLFDSESGQFSTFPTGPVLAPALILCCILYVAKLITTKEQTCEEVAGKLTGTVEWKRKKERHDYLMNKRIANRDDMAPHELYEYRQLQEYLANPKRHS